MKKEEPAPCGTTRGLAASRSRPAEERKGLRRVQLGRDSSVQEH